MSGELSGMHPLVDGVCWRGVVSIAGGTDCEWLIGAGNDFLALHSAAVTEGLMAGTWVMIMWRTIDATSEA